MECPYCGSGNGLFPHCCIFAKHEHDLAQRAAVRREAKEKTAREDARVESIDFVARLADAWDCRGDHIYRATGDEHRTAHPVEQ